jgi:hypothetical protein
MEANKESYPSRPQLAKLRDEEDPLELSSPLKGVRLKEERGSFESVRVVSSKPVSWLTTGTGEMQVESERLSKN